MAIPTFKAELLLQSGDCVGESPVWDAGRQRLFWIDIPQGKVRSIDPAGGAHRSWQRAGAIGSIALAANQGLIAGCAEGFCLLTPDGDGFVETSIAPVLARNPNMRFNDGACDRQGRFWSGSMRLVPDPSDPGGVLYRLDGDDAVPMIDGFVVQNGLAWSPDGRTMYVSDSHKSRASVRIFDYDTQSGTPSNPRLLLDFTGTHGRPDGAAIDTGGGYWIAASDAGRVVRVMPDGRRDAEVIVPTSNPTNLCFGGADLKTMFITSLRPDNPAPLAGSLFVSRTPFQGVPETPFRLTH